MKKNIYRGIIIICLLMLFTSIFAFSNQNKEKSAGLSRKVTYAITDNIKSIQKMEKQQKENLLDKIEHFIRKMAHFTLYTLVGILTMLLMDTYNLKKSKKIGISFFIGVLYAISDEIHQSFVPGRGAMIQDVVLDSSGVIFGILICIGIIAIVKKIFIKIKK